MKYGRALLVCDAILAVAFVAEVFLLGGLILR